MPTPAREVQTFLLLRRAHLQLQIAHAEADRPGVGAGESGASMIQAEEKSTESWALPEDGLALGRRSRLPRVLACAWMALILGLALAAHLPDARLAWAFAALPIAAFSMPQRARPRFLLASEGLRVWRNGQPELVPWTSLRAPMRLRRELFLDYLQVEQHDAPLLLLSLTGLRADERLALIDQVERALQDQTEACPGTHDEVVQQRDARLAVTASLALPSTSDGTATAAHPPASPKHAKQR